MSITKSETLELRSEQDIVRARQVVRKLAVDYGFSLVDQTKMVTAASELARNTVTYGQGGTVLCEVIIDGLRTGLRLTFVDAGPGIADVKLAMTDGWTSGGGLGMGLTGAKRLVNEIELDSQPGKGTRVVVTRWK
jgi:serine/threonine-protein kinase RsbT